MDVTDAMIGADSACASVATNALAGNGPLACLTDTSMTGRFHFWRGASERRYTVSVASIDPASTDLGLPDLNGFVLIPVVRHGTRHWPLAAMAIERTSDRRAAVVTAMANGAHEWHVHLLGPERVARMAIVDDLRARHFAGRQALSA